MAQRLCAACSRFAKDFAEAEEKVSFPRAQTLAPNIHALRKSAQNDCQLCQIIYQSYFYNTFVSWSEETFPIHLQTWSYSPVRDDRLPPPGQDPIKPELLSIGVGKTIESSVWHGEPLIVNKKTEALVKARYSRTSSSIADLSSDEGVEKAVALAKKWLATCCTNHTNCCMSPDNQHLAETLPTRVVDVGSKDEGLAPKLLIPTHPLGGINYVALSYAWGSGHDFAKTTASNLDDMTRCLPWDKLAKTIQDAIIFTRKLSIRYLWVDALCILQSEGPDDAQHRADWSYEAARFGQYYQNATLTIAATGAISSSEGLFLRRPALEFDPEPVILKQNTNRGETNVFIIQPPSPLWAPAIRNAALRTRGWAIQERVLSKRILHFGASYLLWECHESRVTETNPGGTDSLAYSDTGEDFISAFKDIDNRQEDDIMRSWYQFIDIYSSTSFSFHTDKLPALSGIATRIKDRFPQDYIAGIWELAIPEGLAWMARETEEPDPGSDLPSWCWATRRSVSFFFVWDNNDWNPMLKVKSWSVTANGPQTSGQILQARLIISGIFKGIDLSDPSLIFKFGYNTDAEWTDNVTSLTALDPGFSVDRLLFIDDARSIKTIGNHHPCLLIGKAHVPLSDLTGKTLVGVALILEPTGRVGRFQEYRRIGLASLSFMEYWADVQDMRTIELV
ncbi:hypothetical protein FVEN_g9688 [Fusarium venenatum]|uniref:Heterokaryon incompatibility domain-containing protein n=1 Tax=Fusarium venenatum TaxID=56646 RepID=A0A2L2TQM4_9HYPO|nr:uncharacterized protein FVRRES_11020 [Fusarium venenatum]KAG8352262.1 hypothetical protein FVEN_g9688 [Fusarium venenatum]CEI70943.1 unnamed protein product [Fusarium venenatum]